MRISFATLVSREGFAPHWNAKFLAVTALAMALTGFAQQVGPTDSDQVYRVGNGVSQPTIISKEDPALSGLAEKLHAKGTVLLQFVVRPDGTPSNFKVIKPFDYGLDEMALECVRKWRFQPGMKDGSAVAVYATVEANFNYKGGHENYWRTGPMAFALETGVKRPVVEDGSMPKPISESLNDSVVLEFTVDSSGSVRNIHAIHGPESASKLLTGYLAKWKFQPAVKGGRPVGATGQVRFVAGEGDEAAKLALTPPQSQNNPLEPEHTPDAVAPSVDGAQTRTMVNPKEGDPQPTLMPVNGILRKKVGEKDLYSQTTGQTVLRFRVLPKTEFRDQQGAPIRDSLLKPGDHLTILVSPEDPETARQVVLVRDGNAAERESAETPVAEGSVRAPEEKDLEKARTVKAEKPEPQAAAGSASNTGRDDPDPQEIIRRFAAKETELSQARGNYSYRQIVKIVELDPSGSPQGQYETVEDFSFTPDGKRSSVVRTQNSTLHRLVMTPDDLQDLRSVQAFVLTTDQIPYYNIAYVGRQKVNDAGCFAFSVKPKKLEKGKRYFEGQIWVHDRDLQIVKSYGKGVGIVEKGNEFPSFEMYRGQTDGKYWFPANAHADEVLHFPQLDQRISMTVECREYKQFVTVQVPRAIFLDKSHRIV